MAWSDAPPVRRKEPPAPAPEINESDEDVEVDDNVDLFPEEPEEPFIQPTVPDPVVQLPVPGPAVGPSLADLAMDFYTGVLGFTNDASHTLTHDQQLITPQRLPQA